MACASTVAVVVPPPAMSDVFDATSFTICAPMLASLSSSSTSLATVTPSLVTVGVPQDFSMMTLRPRGPRVTFTVLARMLRPMAMLERALDEKTMSLAAIFSLQCVFWFEKSSAELLDDRQDVVLAQDQVLDAVDLDVAARVLAEQDLVAGLHLELAQRTVLLDLAVAHGDDGRLHGLLLRRVGDVQPAGGAALLFDALDQDTVVEGTDLHGSAPYLLCRRFRLDDHPRRGLLCGAGLSFFWAKLLRRALGRARLRRGGHLRSAVAAARCLLRVARGRSAVLGAVRLVRGFALAFARLGRRVQVRVPAAALQLKGGLTDQALDLLLLALRTRPHGRVRHLLPFLELVAAGGARVFIDGHSAPWVQLWRAYLRHERKAVKRRPRVPEDSKLPLQYQPVEYRRSAWHLPPPSATPAVRAARPSRAPIGTGL